MLFIKRITAVSLAVFFFLSAGTLPMYAAAFTDTINAESAILMDADSGTVLYEYNADEALPPASVTKVMTVLLVLEALDKGAIQTTDIVTVSDYASSMGGSQVYLKAGETMTVDDLLKSVVVSSANDAAVALAEYVAGSETSFVSRMNERAKELGMTNTVFKNTNGLDDSDTGHVTSARDIAIMSREVLKHPLILSYSTIWMDSIRDGAFGLTNTNRLVRFYRGCNGLKTGSTAKAGFCISATAKRDDLQLIAVVMVSPNKDARNALAAALLDFGFANYGIYRKAGAELPEITVLHGEKSKCAVSYDDFSVILEKDKMDGITEKISVSETVSAPVAAGDKLGEVSYYQGDTLIGSVDIRADDTVSEMTFGCLLLRMAACFTMKQ